MLIAAESEQASIHLFELPQLRGGGGGNKAPWELFTCGNLLGSLSVTGERLGKEPGFGLHVVLAPEMATRFSKSMASPVSGKPQTLHRVILCSLPPGLYVEHSYSRLTLNYFFKGNNQHK